MCWESAVENTTLGILVPKNTQRPYRDAMRGFPLQHKKLQRLTLPYLQVGTCEVMNLAHTYHMDSFNVFNRKNISVYDDATAAASSISPLVSPRGPAFLGEVVGGGLLDSYTGRTASSFVSSYLAKALSMHTVVPTELRALRKEDSSDPLVAIMTAALARRRGMQTGLGSVVTEWDLQQYAISADAAFFRACAAGRRPLLETHTSHALKAAAEELQGGGTDTLQPGSVPLEESGCRGVWFTATAAPTALAEQQRRDLQERRRQLAPPPQKVLAAAEAEAERKLRSLLDQTPFCLDVAVGGVGNSRAFGVARNPLTEATRSLLDPTRERTVPLSTDHTPLRSSEYRRIITAGGTVDSAVGDIIDGNPYYNVSRSFGHWSMKRDGRRSPVEQKMIALPTVNTWRMLPGDALVLCNHAVFETRQQEDSTMDELAKVVGRGLSRGLPAEHIAASLCDFAIRFGAEHSLQVMVAVAPEAAAAKELSEQHRQGQPTPSASTASTGDAASTGAAPRFEEWVEPGPVYVGACHKYPDLRRRLQLDCERCGVPLATLLRLRYERVRALLPSRHALPLMPYYASECGALQQVMDEEAAFFDADVLRDGVQFDSPQAAVLFEKLAASLRPVAEAPTPPRRNQSRPEEASRVG